MTTDITAKLQMHSTIAIPKSKCHMKDSLRDEGTDWENSLDSGSGAATQS